MGAVKELATELELHWDDDPHGYRRRLPDGFLVQIRNFGDDWLLTAGHFCEYYETIEGAIQAAGNIARQQLNAEAETWAV